MLIQLHLPRSFDAEVTYDEATRIISITPAQNRGTVPLLGVEAVSADGTRKEKTVINFNLSNGKPELPGKRSRSASFDEAGEEPANDAK